MLLYFLLLCNFLPGQIAQLVEQRTENPCVAGSIPALAISIWPENAGVLNFLKLSDVIEVNFKEI